MSKQATAPPTEVHQEVGADLVRSAALSIEPSQVWWTVPQQAALASIGLADTPDGDKVAFLHLCQATGLDPFRREIYLIGRNDSRAPGGKRWTAQTGIDGFRFIAERTSEYLGRVSTEWCGRDGQWTDVWLAEEPPAAARVVVARRIDGAVVKTTGVVLYREFCPMTDEYEGPKGNRHRTGKQVPSGLWGTMPAHMLAKCAEAFAIRSAFPRQAGGVYLHEEMHKEDEATKAREAAEQAQARRQAREQAREQAADRPWAARQGVVLTPTPEEPQQPASEPQVDAQAPTEATPASESGQPDADGIVEGQVVPSLDRTALLAELDEQAATLGTTRGAMLRRWVAQHRKNLEEATDEEVFGVVLERREMVAWKREEAAKAQVDQTAPEDRLPDA